MKKNIGQKVIIRSVANYDHQTGLCDNANSRETRTDVITKVLLHGVKTKNNGYVNNKRILSTE